MVKKAILLPNLHYFEIGLSEPILFPTEKDLKCRFKLLILQRIFFHAANSEGW